MKKSYDVAVIGGGASGLAAAITVKRSAPELTVAIFEKKECTGKKLSAAGNGRCNLSNIKCEFIEQVIDFFGSVGISIRKDEEDRLYPYSEDAKSVTEILTSCAIGEGTELFLNSEIRKMEADPKGGFLLFVDNKFEGTASANGTSGIEKYEKIHAKKVLIATGGKSYGFMGTTGDGYVMARQMGHKVTRLIPGLTAVEVCEDLSDIKGIRSKAQVTLYRLGKPVFSEKGEVQFRSDSLSGICVMNMSRHIKAQEGEPPSEAFSRYSIDINLAPDFGAMEISNMIKSRFMIKNLSALDSMKTLVKEPLARRILLQAGIEPERSNSLVATDEKKLAAVADNLVSMKLRVKGLKGWNEAQITVGGVALDEVESLTMESKIVKGLFFSGEVLDYDGPCGGYNLHNAWLTGLRAGKGMAAECTEFTS